MRATPPVRIAGIGSYLPVLSHTNETLPPLDEPISDADLARIGVFRRGWASDAEGVAEMAAAAATRALDRAQIGAGEIDLLVLSNWTARRYLPDFAPRVQEILGAKRAFAFDLGCACAGFVTGVATAERFLDGARVRRALVVASETTSRRARPGSRGTLVLGDAAGAFVLDRDEARGGRLLDWELASDGSRHGIMHIDEHGWVRTDIAQRELVGLAASSMKDVADRLLARNGLSPTDVAWFVPHSGTAGVQAAVARTFAIPPERILTNFADVGNVSSASIPAALDHFLALGVIRPGDLVLCAAVGSGWYAAAMLATA